MLLCKNAVTVCSKINGAWRKKYAPDLVATSSLQEYECVLLLEICCKVYNLMNAVS